VINIVETKFREKKTIEELFVTSSIIFSNMLKLGADEELYEEIVDKNKLYNQLQG
jgi:hypothetical protein